MIGIHYINRDNRLFSIAISSPGHPTVPSKYLREKNDRRVSTFHRNSKCAVMPWAIFRLEIKSQALVCNFINKEALVWVLSCEFCEIFKNSFFTEHLRATASDSLLFQHGGPLFHKFNKKETMVQAFSCSIS